MSGYIRWQSAVLDKALKTRRIVLLSGARQVGKTTLTKSKITPQVTYRTLDDRLLLQAAQSDPNEFVKKNNPEIELIIIDEVQKAPDLIPAIKIIVDQDAIPGQFLLTGSADIQQQPDVTESLAGRIRRISLRPLAQAEIKGHEPSFLDAALNQTLIEPTEKLSRDEVIQIALRGGYPEPLNFDPYDRMLWHQDYVQTLLERDLKDIVNIKRQEAMQNLIQVVAAWSTKPIDLSAIGSSLGLQRSTLESYFNALEGLYLIDKIPAYFRTDYDRIGKQSKLIMNDSGLMASILRWDLDSLRWDGDRLGKLIETHVGNELQKQIDASENRYVMSHYRDKDQHEIDYLISDLQGNLLGIEVKASSSPTLSDFKNLIWFKEHLAVDGKKFIGIVFHMGSHLVAMKENLWAVPISTLY